MNSTIGREGNKKSIYDLILNCVLQYAGVGLATGSLTVPS